MVLAVTFGVVILVLQLIAIADGRTIPSEDFWLFNAVVAMGASISGVAIALQRPANLVGWVFIAGDRRFDSAHYDAEETAASFAAELRDEVDPTRAQAALLAAVDSASQPRGVAVWIRGESR